MSMDRRELLTGAAGIAALATGSPQALAAARPRRIATEEGFSIPELAAAQRKYLGSHADEPGMAYQAAGFVPIGFPDFPQRLLSLGDLRLCHMDEAGIDASLLMVGSPGVQILETGEARDLSVLINDRVAEACTAHPKRFYGLAAVAPQDPEGAAKELQRAVQRLGLKGALINSHTKGEYLDQPKFRPILEAAQALDVPIYIHPREPSPTMVKPFQDYMLETAIWGYAAETGLHAVRLIMSGLFDELPRLRIVLGHLGEGLPFFMDRLDIRYRLETAPGRPKLKQKPSDYFKAHFVVTSSGMNWPPAVEFCQRVLGPEKVLFAADYPFEDPVQAVTQANGIQMSRRVAEQFWHGNAEKVFRL